MPAAILVVDDEQGVNDLICDTLRMVGHEVASAANGSEALGALREFAMSLVILDINMPLVDGFAVLSRMREAGDTTPVIVLTARSGDGDVRAAFGLGADDFVRKPFSIDELVMRVDAVLRRTSPDPHQSRIRVGAVLLDGRSRRVSRDGVDVALSATEFRLLQVMMEASGEALSKDLLLRRIWGLDATTETTVLETYVSYLRRKLGSGVSIRTVRGVGYELEGERIRS